MNFIQWFVDFIMHIDDNLAALIQQFGLWIYVLIFLIIFMETGLVFTPFLPGDSLLFAAGAFAAQGVLNIITLLALLTVASILGDTVNYWAGHYLGLKVFHRYSRFLKKEYLEKTEMFYEKHGGKTIILARFVPVVRTFAPFVAGIGKMHYGRFLLYNVAGGIIWVAFFVLAGYFFGNIQWVKDNFSLVILGIILLSFVPAVIEYFRNKL